MAKFCKGNLGKLAKVARTTRNIELDFAQTTRKVEQKCKINLAARLARKS